MNEYVNVRVAKNGFIVERMFWPKGSAYMVTESHVAWTPAEVLKLVADTLKRANWH